LDKNEIFNTVFGLNEEIAQPQEEHKQQQKGGSERKLIDKDHDNNSSKYNPNNGNMEVKNELESKTYYLQKFSNNQILAESILINNRPMFLVSENGKISIKPQLEFEDKIIKPPETISYVNKPYVFTSEEDVNSCIENTKKESLDTLYGKVKSIWRKYVDADEFHIVICAADTIFTYFQDRIGLTHYLFFVGNNGSGKSNNLAILNMLAYRNMMSTDITPANIYQYLQSGEEGMGTICEDEADDMDEDREKMRIYKNGYTTGYPVLRIDTSFGRKQLKFNTFGFKACAAERLPDSLKAKGFNQRTIEIHCVYGYPEYDISEVLNPAGEEKYQQLLDELLETRKTLLIYRLLHCKDKIPDIKVKLENREKQLFKPVLRIFQNTETFKELTPVIGNYVSQKREKNIDTLNAFLYRIISDLIRNTNSLELSSNDIWQTIIDPNILPGRSILNKPLSYDSVEFGIISQKQIIQILIDVFGGTKPRRHGSSNKLIFDPNKLKKLGRIYELSLEVKLMRDGIDGDDGIDVGLDRHLKDSPQSSESSNIPNNLSNNCEKVRVNNTKNVTHIHETTVSSSNDLSQLSHLSQPKFLKCPQCKFQNIYQEEIDRHLKLTHGSE
jgi:hypothetical protein